MTGYNCLLVFSDKALYLTSGPSGRLAVTKPMLLQAKLIPNALPMKWYKILNSHKSDREVLD